MRVNLENAMHEAARLDAEDPLSHFRAKFVRHEDPVAYLDGNSLGRPPKPTLQRVARLLEYEWGERLIRSWDERWVDLPVEVGDRLGAVVIGAAAGQTVIADSTTVNLFKVLHAACGLRPDRDEIVVDAANFPTDRYVVESVAASRGLTVRWLRPDPESGVTVDLLARVLGSRTAVVLLSHVDYRSAYLADIAGLTTLTHDAGAVVVWDLCHSAGVVPVRLDDVGADFAVGCTYKYLNAGPGAPAFLYVAAGHLEAVRQPIEGWFGAEDVFAMAPAYKPATGIRRMLSGTPSIVGVVAVDEGVGMVAEAGLSRIRGKAAALTGLAIELTDAWLAPHGWSVASPRDADERGGHIVVRGHDAAGVADELMRSGVVPDFRNPDLVRLGLSPLTTSFAEVATALSIMRGIIAP